jgi:rubrerythrin
MSPEEENRAMNSEEHEAAENFYFLLEQVYNIKLETGLENEIVQEDSTDIFDAFDLIKQAAEE